MFFKNDSNRITEGIFKESDGLSFIGYGLYNDSENEKSIEDVYSRMFTSIAENREND